MVVAGGLLVWGFWANRGRTRVQTARGRTNRAFLILFVALLAGVALASRFGGFGGLTRQIEPQRVQQEGQAPATQEDEAAERYQPRFRLLPAALAALLAAGALVAVVRAGGRPTAGEELTDEELDEELDSMLAATLADLRAVADARAAVIAAYARTERALERYGLPREESEGPREYLARVAPELQARRTAAHRLLFELTHLYERAKFSPHEIDAGMKEDAIATLEALRAQLGRERT